MLMVHDDLHIDCLIKCSSCLRIQMRRVGLPINCAYAAVFTLNAVTRSVEGILVAVVTLVIWYWSSCNWNIKGWILWLWFTAQSLILKVLDGVCTCVSTKRH